MVYHLHKRARRRRGVQCFRGDLCDGYDLDVAVMPKVQALQHIGKEMS